MPNYDALDHPIWEALTTAHASMAQVCGDARRYPADVSPLAALREPSAQAFAHLAQLVTRDETVALFTEGEVYAPSGWEIERERWLDQMVYEGPMVEGLPSVVELGAGNVPEMLALTALTEPGPFKTRTIGLGRYVGVASGSGLAAMAGERLRGKSFTEVSAVCTHPDHRGRGYARTVVMTMCNHILERGQIPMLHVKAENGARIVYEKLGFRVRAQIRLTVVRRVLTDGSE